MKLGRALALGGLTVAMGAAFVPATSAANAGRHFGRPVHVDMDNPTAEPSISVAPDGTEYIVAPDGPGVRTPGQTGGQGIGGSLVWRSRDHGRTWSRLGSFDTPTGGGDTDIAISPDGTLYASGLSYLACSTVSRSTDHGDTWLPMPVAGCGQAPVVNDREWNATYGNGIVYSVIGDTVNNQIDLIRSVVTNPVVVPSTTMKLSTTADYQWPGTVAVDQRNGRTYTVWNTAGAPNNCDQSVGSDKCSPAQASRTQPDLVEISVLANGATTAPKPLVVAKRTFDTYDSFVDVTLDKAGGVYVVWSERHPAAKETWAMLAVSHDAGRTWARPVRVNRAPGTTTFPWVTAGDNGRIAVSYYGTPAHGYSPQTVGKTSPWYVYSSFSTNAGRTFTEYRTTPVMHRGAVCTSGTGCAAGSRNLLDFFETDLDRAGCLVTAFADNAVDPTKGAVVSYVRQTAGPGLNAAHPCSVPRR
jgi:hypothetical protein